MHIANPINPDSRVGKEKVNLQFVDDVELGEWKCIRIISPTVNIMDHFTDHKKIDCRESIRGTHTHSHTKNTYHKK